MRYCNAPRSDRSSRAGMATPSTRRSINEILSNRRISFILVGNASCRTFDHLEVFSLGLVHFTDSRGTPWRVWQVETPAARAHLMEASFRNGWLVFEREDGTDRRRLAQVPEDWASLGAERLEKLCASAQPAPAVRSVPSVAPTIESPTWMRAEGKRDD